MIMEKSKLAAAVFQHFGTYRITDEQAAMLLEVVCNFYEVRAIMQRKDAKAEVSAILRQALTRYEKNAH